MLKTFMISTAAVALLTGSAMAQSTGTSPASKEPMTKSQMNNQASNSAKFISQQGADHWVFSKFKGTDVLGPNNEHIGDVSDMVFDKTGKIEGVVVGVGGFLGIGEKNVAIDMSAFQVVPANADSNGSSSSSSSNNDPTNVKLKVSWTKDQLKNAPDFQYYKASSSSTSSTGAPTTGMGRSNGAGAPPAR
jgi:hypothetical protein